MPLLAFPNPTEMALSIKASALVFEDSQSRALLDRIKLVAPSDLNALIFGDTGTGKELVARHIHDLSARRNGPFLAVNCCALSETLIESELFGHEKGAFTGALSTKQGWFEAAANGTIFLDEIGDLPLSMQVKLLRVLQQREVVRVGSHQPIPINVRLIAATNVNLEEAIVAGRFREDLYYRLNVAALHLLPLRQRTGDIMPLAQHFLKVYGQRLACQEISISTEAERRLLSHSWPGNIRELENVIHHALLVARDGTISPRDLNLSVLTNRAGQPPQKNTLDELDRLLESLCEREITDLYAKVEQAALRAAYKISGQNQLATARLLGLSRHVVRARLIQHKILPEQTKNTAHYAENQILSPYTTISDAQNSVRHAAPLAHEFHDRVHGESVEECWGF